MPASRRVRIHGEGRGGGLARGWGPGATLSVLQLEQTPGGQFFHGHRLSQEAEIADWFDRGHEATFAFDVDADPGAGGEPPGMPALGGVRVDSSQFERRAERTRKTANAARRALLAAETDDGGGSEGGDGRTLGASSRAASDPALFGAPRRRSSRSSRSRRRRLSRAGRDETTLVVPRLGDAPSADRARLLERAPAYGTVEKRAGSLSFPAAGRRFSSSATITLARAALATAAVAGVASASLYSRSSGFAANAAALGSFATRPDPSAALGLAGAGTCGGGVQGCELYSPRDCRGRVYSYKPGALAHLQGGKSAATVLAPLGARVTSPAKSLVADTPGLCDVYESIDGGIFDWANPEATAAARVGEGRRRRTAASSSSSPLRAARRRRERVRDGRRRLRRRDAGPVPRRV